MIRPFGERALLVEVDGPPAAQRLDAALRDRPPPGVTGTVPALASVLVELDPSAVVERVAAELRRMAEERSTEPMAGRTRWIPVVYGGDAGPDLASVAASAGRTEAEVIQLHASLEHRVLFLGFAPGFPYLGELPEPIRVPRLATPRTRTPAGSVAITGSMTGIYPAELPGGWPVIGRTPVRLFDPFREPPAYLAPGDAVRFEPIRPAEWEGRAGVPDDW